MVVVEVVEAKRAMSLHLIHASHPALASAQADTVVPSLFLFLFLLVFSLLFFFSLSRCTTPFSILPPRSRASIGQAKYCNDKKGQKRKRRKKVSKTEGGRRKGNLNTSFALSFFFSLYPPCC